MRTRYPENLEAFLLDEDARRLALEDPKLWRTHVWERVERDYGDRLRDLLPSSFGSGVDAEDFLHAFYLRELSAKRTVLEAWAPRCASLLVFLKACFRNFARTRRGKERRERARLCSMPRRWEEWVAGDPETSDPVRILSRRDARGKASRREGSSEALSEAIAAFRRHCATRGLEHYWIVFERHDLRPEAFGNPRYADTAAVLGRSRRDVTNWLARARALVRRFYDDA